MVTNSHLFFIFAHVNKKRKQERAGTKRVLSDLAATLRKIETLQR